MSTVGTATSTDSLKTGNTPYEGKSERNGWHICASPSG
jgi:hypothetical protein